MVKRFHYVRRSKKGIFTQLILPVIFVILAMVFSMINPPNPQEPALELHPWHLIPSQLTDLKLHTFYSNDQPGTEWTDLVEDLIQGQPGLGTRCMDPSAHSIQGYPCEEVDVSKSMWTEMNGNPNATKECSCETGYQKCPVDAAGPEPPKITLPTTDILYNMTGRNITEWLIKSAEVYIKKRYGGLAFGERNNLVEVNNTAVRLLVNRLITAANGGKEHGDPVEVPDLVDDIENLVGNLSTKRNAKIWFNNKGYVSMVSYMNIMNNLLLRAHLPPGVDISKYGISVTNHPMNRTEAQMSQYAFIATIKDVLIAISVIFAMSMVPASFVLFLIEERVSNSKHLQMVSGVNPVVYWVANFTWDMLNYALTTVACVFVFLAFQQRSYVSPGNAPCLIVLLLLYGWAVTPMMYPASFLFSVPSTAFVSLSCLNIFLGIVSTISTFILEALMEADLDAINNILKKVFLLLPHYCLGRGLIDMTKNQFIADTFAAFGENMFRSPFTWDLVGRNLFSMTILGVVFFLLTLCIQYSFWYYKLPCLKHKKDHMAQYDVPDEDIDVARERQRVMGGNASEDVITIEGLTKIYRKKKLRAVDNLSVGVHKGECFGLLGVNGAGKTTTFKMLTGDLNVTSGIAHVAGHSILDEMTAVHQNLGYCPQFDAVCPLLTGKEHLELYARLRGVPEKDVPVVAAWGIRKLGLVKHVKKCAGQYSGGNKRKLSTAIALVGNPKVIFLDEPTTGMDPRARRFLWDCINNITKGGRSVILTSHSMEECEALCGRIAIMVNGVFKCIGSIQHLKTRFGEGYTVILRVSGRSPNLTPVIEFIESTFQGAALKERHHNMLQYQLGSETTSLAYIFGELEAVRDRFHIEDYSVSQTTLDQVFINFAKLQTDLLDDELRAAVASGTGPVVGAGKQYDPMASGYHANSVETASGYDLDYVTGSSGATSSDLWDEESLRGSTINLVPPGSLPGSRQGSARFSSREGGAGDDKTGTNC